MPVGWEQIAEVKGYPSASAMLRDMYPKFTIHELALRFGCSVHAVREQLRRCNIEIRKRGGSYAQESQLEKITVEEYKEQGARAIADRFGLDITTVYKHFRRKHGIVLRPRDPKE